ncbi:hypothetical protein M422DRAFT_44472 [Sphaerobolus stellatus SS14]|nr:hypothetical protein M422DRAFT_44472 [Sphaerobolus stellatus SS14]
MRLRCHTVHHEVLDSAGSSDPASSNLQVVFSPPYVLSVISDFEVDGNNAVLWKMMSGRDPPLQQVARLSQPIPDDIKWINVHEVHGILSIGSSSHEIYREGSKISVYSTSSGTKLQDIQLPVPVTTKAINSDRLVVATIFSIFRIRLPRIYIFKVSESGLEEVQRLPIDPDTKLDDRTHIHKPVIYLPDGRLVTMDKPTPVHDLVINTRNSRGAIEQRARIDGDRTSPHMFLRVVDFYVLMLKGEQRLVTLVEEIDTSQINNPNQPVASLVYIMDVTDLSTIWKARIPHKTEYVVQNHDLDLLVAVGSLTYAQQFSYYCLTFIDPSNGNILKEEVVPRAGIVRDPYFVIRPRPQKISITERPECTDEDFILLQPAGEAIIQSLKSIFEHGLLCDETGDAVLQMIPFSLSEPDHEGKVSLQRWIWAGNFAVGPKMIVIFPPRGRDMYVVEW